MVLDERAQRTYQFERRRALMAGILETASTTFLLLVTMRWFAAGAVAKALVAGGGSVGLLVTPWVVKAVEASGLPPVRSLARLYFLGAWACLVMACWPILPIFVLGAVVAMAAASAAIPLLTQIYQENYPDPIRGRLFSRTIMIRIGTAAVFSELAGRALSNHFGYFPVLLLIFALAFVLSGYFIARCPSKPLSVSDGTHPFRALRFVGEDRLFRQTLICWMLMGFANLMMFPLRVEYLANPRYGQNLSVGLIALLTGVLPNLARLVMSPIWGWLFDHMNFFVLRVILNTGFALGILTFFLSDSWSGLVLGGLVFGISLAGGDVAWSLWVIKFAPADRVADYMSVHTFFTGIRGVAAPLVAFYLLGHLSIGTLGWISAGLIVIATLLLLPEIKFGRVHQPAVALIEDVSE